MIIFMIRLDDIGEASKLAFSHMKPGVLTNHMMTADEYRADIAHGALHAHVWDGGVLFLRKRESYHMLSYYINDLNVLPDCNLPEDVFCEIAFKPSGAKNAGTAVDFWKRAELRATFERIRMTRPAGGGMGSTACVQIVPLRVATDGYYASLANEQDSNDCYDLLRANFDHITGHLPDFHELRDNIEAGFVLCLKDSQSSTCGLIRWLPRAASIEIRQLALREDMRGKGMARYLLDAFTEICGNNKNTVWMRDGYAPALKSYAAAGFAPDGWRSVVMCV